MGLLSVLGGACSLYKPVIDTARVGLTEEFVLPRTVLRTVFRTSSRAMK